MFYVIQKSHSDVKKPYIAYTVPRFIVSEKSKNIIFEFKIDGQIKRKWAPKEEVILLTDDKALFHSILTQLETLKNSHLSDIETAQRQLDQQVDLFFESINKEFEQIQSQNNLTDTVKN